ncbi:hypothetical protein BIW11_06477, partial [Tropilaelaps mercedesae]
MFIPNPAFASEPTRSAHVRSLLICGEKLDHLTQIKLLEHRRFLFFSTHKVVCVEHRFRWLAGLDGRPVDCSSACYHGRHA